MSTPRRSGRLSGKQQSQPPEPPKSPSKQQKSSLANEEDNMEVDPKKSSMGAQDELNSLFLAGKLLVSKFRFTQKLHVRSQTQYSAVGKICFTV
jgi:hypothetical protein